MAIIDTLFGRSPIKPLQQHMEAAVACARQVLPLLEAVVAGDEAGVTSTRTQIVALEHRADELKHEIRSHLPRRLFMAFERRDMLEILDCQDSIADTTQDIADLFDMRSMHAPAALEEPLLALAREVIVTCELSEKIVNELDELIETGFGPHEVARVSEMIAGLNQQESNADLLGEKALRVLFSLEDELGVGTYFWYETINWIGDIADYAERVGNRLRLLIAS